jgi:GTP-binding protein EngB required for normal cell division
MLLALGISLGLLLLLLALLFVTESALNVWARLQETPWWVLYGYLGGLATLGGAAGWLVWRLLRPTPARPAARPVAPPTEAEIEQRLASASEAGIDVGAAQRELAELQRRRATGRVYVSLFGEISSGKSSLIRALLPQAQAAVGAAGGTTRRVTHYTWQSSAGDELVLTDVPGLNEAGGELDALSREEALRAHVVIYVCDGDLTRDQYRELQALLRLHKPTLLALNKIDRYSAAELEQIRKRLQERLIGAIGVELVPIQSGGTQDVVRVFPDGHEELTTRVLPPRVDTLREALQRRIDQDQATLEGLRDTAVFVLAGRRIDEMQAAHRAQQAEALVGQYSRKAVVGALAAITPGSDLLIQGYLGMSLVKALCTLYEVPTRQVDMQHFLDLVQRHVGKQALPLLLAVAGNGFKAFPGMGTVAGGLLHAVAYGLLFDTLGRAVAQTLASRGQLYAAPAMVLFKEKLGENLETRARRLAQLVLAARRGNHDAP